MAKIRLGSSPVGGESEPEGRQETPPKAAKTPKTIPGGAPKVSITDLEKELRQTLEFVAGGLYFADPVTAKWTEQKAPEIARAWAAWAKQNASVRRTLETLVTGTVAGSAIGVTVVWALGCYLIFLARRGELPPAWGVAGGFMGVPLPDPVYEAPGPQDEAPEAPGADRAAGGTIEI